MTPWQGMLVVAAGVAAGGINAVVGSGSLVTFPALLAVGCPPVLANVSNTVGLVPGTVAAAIGYRAELEGQRSRLLRLGTASALGATAGAVLLLVMPPTAFRLVVPILVALACLLVLIQPRLGARFAADRHTAAADGGAPLWAGVLAAGVYGGYFGAAQGVILIGLLGALLGDGLQRLNGTKNVLAAVVNIIAATVFVCITTVDWIAVALIAVGSTLGGVLGSRLGRKLSPTILRTAIVAIGMVVVLKSLASAI